MSQKGSDEEKDKGLEIDFDVFEKQIDLEIDKLFVPSEFTAVEAGQVQEIDEEKKEDIQGPIEMEPLVLESSDIVYVEEPPSASRKEDHQETAFTAEEIEFLTPVEPIAVSPEREMQVEALRREESAELEILFQDSSGPAEAEIEFSLPARDVEPAMELGKPEIGSFQPDEIPDLEIGFAEPLIPLSLSAESPEVRGRIGSPFTAPASPAAPTPQISRQKESHEQMLAQFCQPDDPEELDRLIEAVDIAYLTIDWDFSAENIAALESALLDLQPYWKRVHEASSIVKVMRAVLQHLKKQTDSASPPIIDFISNSLEFLKSIMLSEIGPGPRERAQLRSLIDSLQSIKSGKAPAVKEPKPEIETPQPEGVGPETLSPTAPTSQAAAERLNEILGSPLREFGEWMASYRERSNVALQRLDEESQRLFQLEQTLGKKPALAPVTSRLTRVRSTMAEFISVFRQNELEWTNREESLRKLERSLSDVLSASPAEFISAPPPASPHPPASPSAQEPMVEAAPAQEEPEQPTAARAAFAETMTKAGELRQEQVCLFEIAGHRFALPASSVVKIEKLPDRKARKLIGRGYATLDDFKPLFKSLKTGLLGPFIDLPLRDLKAYRFLTLPQDILQLAGTVSTETSSASPSQPVFGGVILVSNRQYHGMIFTDPTGAEIQSETIEMTSRDEIILGMIQTGSLSSVKVLNIDLILKKLHDL